MNAFEWCGYNWKSEMEGGRIVHPSYPWYWLSGDAIKHCDDGGLELYAKYNPKDVEWKGKTYHPVMECALMRTVEKFSYGTFSCEIMCPSGYYLWPSFWASGNGNWPPEIDIMEGWSDNNDWFDVFDRHFPYISLSWDTTTNVHYRDDSMSCKDISSKGTSVFKQCKNPSENFIKYECEWLPDKITFKANGKTVRKVKGDVCKKLTDNLEHPDNGFEMNVIFDVLCENPNEHEIKQVTPMVIRNFKYEKNA